MVDQLTIRDRPNSRPQLATRTRTTRGCSLIEPVAQPKSNQTGPPPARARARAGARPSRNAGAAHPRGTRCRGARPRRTRMSAPTGSHRRGAALMGGVEATRRLLRTARILPTGWPRPPSTTTSRPSRRARAHRESGRAERRLPRAHRIQPPPIDRAAPAPRQLYATAEERFSGTRDTRGGAVRPPTRTRCGRGRST